VPIRFLTIELRCKKMKTRVTQRAHSRKMNLGTWEAIARRQAWYVIVLEKKLAEWTKERLDACTDLETLRDVLALAKRVDRHEQLMIRHLSKGVRYRERKRALPSQA
jgi:hypothetical protein